MSALSQLRNAVLIMRPLRNPAEAIAHAREPTNPRQAVSIVERCDIRTSCRGEGGDYSATIDIIVDLCDRQLSHRCDSEFRLPQDCQVRLTRFPSFMGLALVLWFLSHIPAELSRLLLHLSSLRYFGVPYRWAPVGPCFILSTEKL